MIKKELVERIAEETGFLPMDVRTVIQMALDEMIEALARGERIEFREFGVFESVKRRPRIGRNPAHPQQTYQVPEHRVVRFKPGKIMKDKVRGSRTS